MFNPVFTITAKIANALMHIEAIRQEINDLPITPRVLATLRESARMSTTHYSTMIEGNRLTEQEVVDVITKNEHFPGRERDEKEVLGFYCALEKVEHFALQRKSISEENIKVIHALVMAGGKKRVKPSKYRTGQNVIRDSSTRRIVYLPPEAHDVPILMKDLVDWINKTNEDLPCPLRAGIAHYQFATIHPYYDGNGRTARLLTTLILHLGSYGLKGLYSLEEYYAKDLQAYYQALAIGPSHNYYLGRLQADITPWIEYFCVGMVDSFENVRFRAMQARRRGSKDQSDELKKLDIPQRKILSFFRERHFITSHDIEKLFGFKPRTARNWCHKWVSEGFFVIADESKKTRKYTLAPKFDQLLID